MAILTTPALASGGPDRVVDGINLGPSDVSRMALARSDANRLLSLAWHPSGARQLTTWVRVKGFELSSPGASIGSPDQIDIARFYLAGRKSQGVSWLNTRVPAGGSLDGEGGTDRANLEWSYAFPSTHLLPQSDLQYTKRILPDGNVELRVDGQVAWWPQKSPFSIIPSGATMVEAVYSPDGNTTPPATERLMARTTSVATISLIRSQINALPAAYPRIMSCPYESPGSITVRFFQSAHPRAFASVYFPSRSCGRIQVSQFSSTHQLLGSGDGGGGFEGVSSVMKLLGLKNQQ
jgi:hypothetical protein